MKRMHPLLRGFLLSALGLCAALWFFTAMHNLRQGQAQEGLEQLENALRRGAVACYAAEGVYPPTVDYLCEHYGVQVDESRYHVFYEIFAQNLMPQITVLERSHET